METIGQRIKKIREAAGVSQQYLAEKVGVSRVAVTKWESGQTSNLKLDNLMKLCNFLGISVEYLIHGEESRSGNKPIEFISRRDIDANEINEDLKSPDLTDGDVTVIKSVIKGLKIAKNKKDEQANS